eukprot:scaffold68404_cov63-Phaeocystis_antarctica.AAC.4
MLGVAGQPHALADGRACTVVHAVAPRIARRHAHTAGPAVAERERREHLEARAAGERAEGGRALDDDLEIRPRPDVSAVCRRGEGVTGLQVVGLERLELRADHVGWCELARRQRDCE